MSHLVLMNNADHMGTFLLVIEDCSQEQFESQVREMLGVLKSQGARLTRLELDVPVLTIDMELVYTNTQEETEVVDRILREFNEGAATVQLSDTEWELLQSAVMDNEIYEDLLTISVSRTPGGRYRLDLYLEMESYDRFHLDFPQHLVQEEGEAIDIVGGV